MGLIKPIGQLERGMQKESLSALGEADAQLVVDSDKYDLLKVYLHGDLEVRKDKLKHHEELLKNLEGKTGSYVDEETGELIQLVAPEYEVIETIMVKL